MKFPKFVTGNIALCVLLQALSSCAPSGLKECPALDSDPVRIEEWRLNGFSEYQINSLKKISIINNTNIYYTFENNFHPAKIDDMNNVYKYQGILLCNKNIQVLAENSVADGQFIVTAHASDSTHAQSAITLFEQVKKVAQHVGAVSS